MTNCVNAQADLMFRLVHMFERTISDVAARIDK